MLSIGFMILQNGLLLDEITVQNIKIKQLYIKWNEKIDLSVEEIQIKKTKTQNKSINYKDIDLYLKKLLIFSNAFNSITVENILFDNIDASFKYRINERGFLVAHSPDFQFKGQIYFQESFLNLDITQLIDEKKKLSLTGSLHFNPSTIELSSKLLLNINNDLNAFLYIHSDLNNLDFKLKSLNNIHDLAFLINMFHLPTKVRYWALDAIDMSSITLKKAYGHINFNQTKGLIKNIYVLADVNDLNYTYNPKLDAVHTKYTELEFKDGVLNIRPKKAFSYNQNLQNSWLKIDFTTKKEELLTLYLLFDGILNKDMLHILNTYKIKLPFLQKKGDVKTDLTIKVSLRTISIDAQGDFFVKTGNFDYLGLNINIYNALIKLNNYDVSVKNMQASYQDIAKADVDLRYNAKLSEGTIFFLANKIHLNSLNLITTQKPLKIKYHIRKGLDTIEVENSQWKAYDYLIDIEKVSAPFNLDQFNIQIPTTYFDVNNTATGFISGDIDIDQAIFHLNADLLTLNFMDTKLDQSNAPLQITYDKKLILQAKETISLQNNGAIIKINHMLIEFLNGITSLKNMNINIDNYITATISAKNNPKNKTNLIELKDLKIKNPETGTLVYNKPNLMLKLIHDKQKTLITAKEINTSLLLMKKGWLLHLKSLKGLSKYSDLLKTLDIQEGDLKISRNYHKDYTDFDAYINSPYKILTKDDTPVSDYYIKGQFNKKIISLNINKLATLKIKDTIEISMDHAGFNVDEILKLLKDSQTHTGSSKGKNINLIATNSYLDLGNNRKAIADTIKLQYYNKVVTAQLEHGKGIAGFKLDKNQFHLYGKEFNSQFMENLFMFSKFKNGSLDFSMSGDIHDYTGVFYMHDTTIVDYKILNNILAFINTVPSLMTFSIPGYSKNGLFVNSAYMQFAAKKGVFSISDFYLDSKEITITGKGVADINKDTIDINLNLKTDLGSNASKIPIVGYVILGKDNVSTGLKISGKLSDPTVTSLIVKDIVVAPFNIIKRTLMLPYELLKSPENNKTQEK
jgi:hypothetical protein